MAYKQACTQRSHKEVNKYGRQFAYSRRTDGWIQQGADEPAQICLRWPECVSGNNRVTRKRVWKDLWKWTRRVIKDGDCSRVEQIY